jgi:hypothetical protein
MLGVRNDEKFRLKKRANLIDRETMPGDFFRVSIIDVNARNSHSNEYT